MLIIKKGEKVPDSIMVGDKPIYCDVDIMITFEGSKKRIRANKPSKTMFASEAQKIVVMDAEIILDNVESVIRIVPNIYLHSLYANSIDDAT